MSYPKSDGTQGPVRGRIGGIYKFLRGRFWIGEIPVPSIDPNHVFITIVDTARVVLSIISGYAEIAITIKNSIWTNGISTSYGSGSIDIDEPSISMYLVVAYSDMTLAISSAIESFSMVCGSAEALITEPSVTLVLSVGTTSIDCQMSGGTGTIEESK